MEGILFGLLIVAAFFGYQKHKEWNEIALFREISKEYKIDVLIEGRPKIEVTASYNSFNYDWEVRSVYYSGSEKEIRDTLTADEWKALKGQVWNFAKKIDPRLGKNS